MLSDPNMIQFGSKDGFLCKVQQWITIISAALVDYISLLRDRSGPRHCDFDKRTIIDTFSWHFWGEICIRIKEEITFKMPKTRIFPWTPYQGVALDPMGPKAAPIPPIHVFWTWWAIFQIYPCLLDI